jgi:hypothetical protein
MQELFGGADETCRKKRRRKSSIGSCSSGSSERRRNQSRSIHDQEDDEVDENGCPVALRTIGRSASFKESHVEELA